MFFDIWTIIYSLSTMNNGRRCTALIVLSDIDDFFTEKNKDISLQSLEKRLFFIVNMTALNRTIVELKCDPIKISNAESVDS